MPSYVLHQLLTLNNSQRFFDKFENNEDGMINQEEVMKALAEEKNLVDILTQNGRYYEGMDLWKYSILFNWHSCSMLIHCNFVESINQVFRIDLKYFQRTQLIVAMGKSQSKTKLSEEDVLFLEENTTMNRAKIMVTYGHKMISYTY